MNKSALGSVRLFSLDLLVSVQSPEEYLFPVTGVLSPAVLTLPQYSLADRHYLRFLFDNEYMDGRNITCLISFIINVTKQNLFATMRGSGRNAGCTACPFNTSPNFRSSKTASWSIKDGKFSRGGQAGRARVNTGGDGYGRKDRRWEFLKWGKQEK